ncbi:hypothetical protein [Bradyrhizobium glycinis]|nr:hypothetical protein [Bradyrhizobium glycinis]MBH5371581.1 hypothetical protein [Bradyrhizobium glycinis]
MQARILDREIEQIYCRIVIWETAAFLAEEQTSVKSFHRIGDRYEIFRL